MEAGGEVVLFLKMLHQLKINKTDERILKLSQLTCAFCTIQTPVKQLLVSAETVMTTINMGLLHHLIQHKRTSETAKPNNLHTEKLHDVKVKNCAI